MGKGLKRSIPLLAVFILTVVCAFSVSAAPRNKWVTRKGGTCYYDRHGEKRTGLCTIKGKQYYFDASGVLKRGWRKVKLKGKWAYCYFGPKKGIMSRDCRDMNGFTIGKDGRARITPANRRKMRMMVKANEIVDQITKPTWSREKKLSACYAWVCKAPGYTPRVFDMKKDWGPIYAKDIFFGEGGNCFSFSSAFAFLANAIGYEDVYVCTDTDHGWAEINGLVYDPALNSASHSMRYYGCGYEDFETKTAKAIRI